MIYRVLSAVYRRISGQRLLPVRMQGERYDNDNDYYGSNVDDDDNDDNDDDEVI